MGFSNSGQGSSSGGGGGVGGSSGTPGDCACMTKSSQAGIVTATNTKITLSTVSFDNNSLTDPTTSNRINIKNTGNYFIFAKGGYVNTGATGTDVETHIYRNGADIGFGINATPGSFQVVTDTSWAGPLSAGDYIELFVYQNSGSTQTINNSLLYVEQVAATSVSSTSTSNACSMTSNTAQAIANLTDAKILLNNVLFDTNSMTDPTTNNRINIKKTGNYNVTASMYMNAAATPNEAQVIIKKNGATTLQYGIATGAGSGNVNPVAVWSGPLSQGDYLELHVYQNTGTTQNTNVSVGQQPMLSVIQVGSGAGTGTVPGDVAAMFKASQAGIANTTYTKITLDTVNFDNNSLTDPVTNHRINIKSTGNYYVEARCTFGLSANQQTQIALYKNGVSITGGTGSVPSDSAGTATPIMFWSGPCVAGDYIEVYGYQNSGSTQTITNVLLYVQQVAASTVSSTTTADICSMTRNTAQSIPASAVTKILLNNVLSDTNSMTDPTTNNRINIKKTGTYLINGSIYLGSLGSNTSVYVYIYKNGSVIQVSESASSSGGDTAPTVVWAGPLNAGDFIELDVWQSSTGAANTGTAVQQQPMLAVTQIGVVGSGGTSVPGDCASMVKASQSGVASATFTKVTLDTVNFDNNSLTDPKTNNRINIQKTGNYLITARCTWNGISVNTESSVNIYKNGVVVSGGTGYNMTDGLGNSSPVMYWAGTCVVGDYIEVWVTQNSGSAQALSNGGLYVEQVGANTVASTSTADICSMQYIGSTSVPNTTYTKIPLNTVVDDTNSMTDPTTNNRITIKKTGNYLVTGQCYLNTGGVACETQTVVYKNGAYLRYGSANSLTGNGDNQGTAIYSGPLNQGDYLELYGWQNSGGALTAGNVGGVYPMLTVTQIGVVGTGSVGALDTLPIGAIVSYGGSTAPSSWLLCDGTAYSRSTYSALFAAIGTTYGAGDGSTTFNVPNKLKEYTESGYIDGLTLSTAGSSSTFTVAAGEAVGSNNIVTLVNNAPISKTTAVWAAGTGNGSLDTGPIAASTWYHVFIIGTSSWTTDILVSLSATAPILPNGYSYFRRIGSLLTDASSNWAAFLQVGDWFWWTSPKSDITNAASASGFTTTTLTYVPPGVTTNALLQLLFTATGAGAVMAAYSTNVTGHTTGGADLISFAVGASYQGSGNKIVEVNSSQQIQLWFSGVYSGVYVTTTGYQDSRGRNASAATPTTVTDIIKYASMGSGTGTNPTGPASGDLTGTFPNPSVTALHFGATQQPLGSTPPVSGQVLQYNGTNIVGANVGTTILRGYIDGLTLVPSTTTMQINPGLAADSTAVNYISLPAAMSKSTTSWVAGTGNGGLLDAGAISATATTYHWYLISGGPVDVGFSTSLTPTLPTGYTLSRRIMSTMWDGGAWIAFIQNGDEVLYNAVQDAGTTYSFGTTATTVTMTVPNGIQVLAIFNFRTIVTAANTLAYLSSLDQSDQAPTTLGLTQVQQQTAAANSIGGWFRIRTNTSGQVRVRMNGATTANSGIIGTMGYVHPRGRNQ